MQAESEASHVVVAAAVDVVGAAATDVVIAAAADVVMAAAANIFGAAAVAFVVVVLNTEEHIPFSMAIGFSQTGVPWTGLPREGVCGETSGRSISFGTAGGSK